MKKVFNVFVLLVGSFSSFSQSSASWVDSVFQTLSIDRKIGQLFMVEVDISNPQATATILEEVKDHGLGGIIITGGNGTHAKKHTLEFQQASKVPLLIGMDAEWGAGKTLDSAFTFPLPLYLAATQNDSLIYETATRIASQLYSLGINLNFAPNAHIANSISGDTLFYFWGDNPEKVGLRVSTYMKAMQDSKILVCAKNFPTQVFQLNSGIPNMASSSKRIDSTLLIPYRMLMKEGVAGILPISLSVPLSFERNAFIQKMKVIPSSITSVFTNTQVEKTFDYKGLLFANVQDTKLTSGKIRWGEPELFAFQAGNDLLINPGNVSQAVKKIKTLIRRDKVYRAQLVNSVKKILAAKYEAVIADKGKIPFNELEARVHSKNIYQNAVAIIADKGHRLPIRMLDNHSFASVSIGINANNLFNTHLARYVSIDEFCIPLEKELDILRNTESYNTVIVGLFPFATPWQPQLAKAILQLAKKTNVILVNFGNPQLLQGLENLETIVQAYTPESSMTEVVAEQLFGALQVKGKLPVAVGALPEGIGETTKSINRLGYALPEEVGVDSYTLSKIKDIAYEAINAGATPGCRVLIARKGKIIYDKAYGWLTYENQVPVTSETIYDLASVTKVAATLQATAFLYERGMIDINKKMSVYLPDLKGSNKEDFLIKDILTHQAGLWPFLPFWAQTMKDSLHMQEFYDTIPSPKYPFTVSDKLYASAAMKDSLWQWIIKSKVREKPARTPYDYRYSDMGFYMLQHLAERLLNQPLEEFLAQNLYEPLGAYTLGYQPRARFPYLQIAPTERDKLFRKSLLIGYVHDQGAAMHGGIAGHAGLFGTAYDLAKLGQLWLNKGNYGGQQYFKPETTAYFEQKQYNNSRRGLGWDKRDFANESLSSTSRYSSASTFGHTGFTGTCMWIDPDYELVYIFLSNRVHPDMTNNKLLSMGIRTRIHDVAYEAIFNFKGSGLK